MLKEKRTYLIEILLVASVFIVNELFFKGIKYSAQGAEVVSLLLITYFFKRRDSNWKAVGFRRPEKWLMSIVYFVACVASIGLIFNFVIQPLFPQGENTVVQSGTVSLEQLLFQLIFIAIGAAAIGEEMLFRGFLLNNINKIIGKNIWATCAAILIQAFLFAILHSGVQGMVSAGVIGVILGVFYVLSGRNLWVVMAAHAVPDILSFIGSYQNQ